MTETENYHMTPDEFRRYGRMVVDWIADYYENVERYPVLSQVKPGEVRQMLPPAPPQQGEPFEAILSDMARSHTARHYSLAIAQLFCFLPVECFRTGNSWRPVVFWPGRARYVVGNQPGLY